MKKILSIVLLIILLTTGCSTRIESLSSNDSESLIFESKETISSESTSSTTPTQASTSIIDNTSTAVPSTQPLASSILHKVALSAYDDFGDAETVPSMRDWSQYLEKNSEFSHAAITGEIELWTYDFKENTQIQLVTYPVSIDNQPAYLGVDRESGNVYKWSEHSLSAAPELMESPAVFSTPLSALEFVKRNLGNANEYPTPFELELIPGDPEAEYSNKYPHYVSQTVQFSDMQTSTYRIDIDQADEQKYIIHSYEIIADTLGDGHTSTSSWVTVYKNGYVQRFDSMKTDCWICFDASATLE